MSRGGSVEGQGLTDGGELRRLLNSFFFFFFFFLFLFCKNININHLEIKELQYVNGRTVGDN